MSTPDTVIATQSFWAGAFIRGSVRRDLDSVCIRKPEFTYIESKSLLSSTFHMRGPLNLLRNVATALAARYVDDDV